MAVQIKRLTNPFWKLVLEIKTGIGFRNAESNFKFLHLRNETKRFSKAGD